MKFFKFHVLSIFVFVFVVGIIPLTHIEASNPNTTSVKCISYNNGGYGYCDITTTFEHGLWSGNYGNVFESGEPVGKRINVSSTPGPGVVLFYVKIDGQQFDCPSNDSECSAQASSYAPANPNTTQESHVINYYYKFATGFEGTIPMTYYVSPSGGGGGSSGAGTPLTPDISFSANPGTIYSGGTSTLSWSATNSTACAVYNDTAGGDYIGSGLYGSYDTDQLYEDTTYSITCSGSFLTLGPNRPNKFAKSDIYLNKLKNFFLSIIPNVFAEQGHGDPIVTTAYATVHVIPLPPIVTLNYSSTIKDLVKKGATDSKGKTYLTAAISNLSSGSCNLQMNGEDLDAYTDRTSGFTATISGLNDPQFDPLYTFQLVCSDPGNTLSNPVNVYTQSGTLTGPATCDIPSGGNACLNVPITWTTTNPQTSPATNSSLEINGVLTPVTNNTVNIPGGSTAKTLISYNKVDDETNTGNAKNDLATWTITPNCVNSTWNGTICAPLLQPDLIAQAPTYSPTTILVGTNVTLSSVIKNQGTATTPTGFYNFFQISSTDPNGLPAGGSQTSSLFKNSIRSFFSSLIPKVFASVGTLIDFPTSGNGIYTVALGNVSPNNTRTISYASTSFFPTNGAYWIRACADKSNSNNNGTITESNESNNCSTWTQVIVGPDLINGVCSNPDAHYQCSTGTSTNQVSGTTTWTWTCSGINGGTPDSCSETKPITAPTVVTKNPVTNITPTTATGGGNVTLDGGSAVTVRGVVWSKLINPTLLSYLGKTNNGTGLGIFTSSMTGLTAGTQYHVRAYASNNIGTSYGDDVIFTTSSAVPSGTISATSCLINSGESTCASRVNWTTANLIPLAATEVARNNPANTHVSYATSGTNVISNINYGLTTFFLIHNHAELARSAVITATCRDPKAVWNGKFCAGGTDLPDLIASVTSPSGEISVGSTTFSATIKNQGTVGTVSPFYNRFQVSTAPNGGGTISNYDTTIKMSPLSAGNTNTATQVILFNTAGTYYMRACADIPPNNPGTIINESDETNNCSSSWVEVKVKPLVTGVDLTASNTSPSGEITIGSTTFSTTVKNQGTVGTGLPFSIRFQVSTAPNGGGTISNYDTTQSASISSGASVVITKSISFNTAGTYYMRACADIPPNNPGVISESDENNNCSSSWLEIIAGSVGSDVGVCGYPHNKCTKGVSEDLEDSATSYLWKCNGLDGSDFCSEDIGGGTGTGAGTLTFDAKPKWIFKGRTSHLVWATSDKDYVCTSPEFTTGGGYAGDVPVKPAQTTTYNLTCVKGKSGVDVGGAKVDPVKKGEIKGEIVELIDAEADTLTGSATVKVINPIIWEN